MQFKTLSWTLIVLASGTGSIYASPAAIGTLHERDTAIARADCNWCGLCSFTSVVPGIMLIPYYYRVLHCFSWGGRGLRCRDP
jgi:hypothetical protein